MKFYSIVIFFLCGFSLRAQTIDWTKVHTTTAAAIDDLYNLRYAESEAGCNEVIKQAPGDPRGYFYKAMVYYTRFSNAGDDTDYKAFLKTSQQVEQVCDRLLKNNPKDSRAMFYMGGILGYRGLLNYKAEKHLDAVSDGFIAKYDGDGMLFWVRRLGGKLEQHPTLIRTDRAGNIYVSGWYTYEINFVDHRTFCRA
ncbi:MAG TPA: hypothetical protein VEC36_04935 [Patescibacteria group bacterium]|nr:hypothetical protein [Patescibacteria group bacterium]